jgi:hypothetical protein
MFKALKVCEASSIPEALMYSKWLIDWMAMSRGNFFHSRYIKLYPYNPPRITYLIPLLCVQYLKVTKSSKIFSSSSRQM